MKTRLTKTTVEAIEPGSADAYAWDDRVAGFGVKVTPKGSRIYVLKYRAGTAQRWLTLGRHGEITAEQARAKAVKLRGAIADGEDPARGRDERAVEPTVDALADRYLAEYARPHKKPRSAEEDRRNLALHVRPVLGARKVIDVTRQDILALHHKMRATPTAANRTTTLLSTMFRLAEEWGMRPENSNPARRIKKFAERKHERFLSLDELQRLGAALNQAEADGEHPSAVAIIRLLLLSGCRKSEILSLRWEWIDERGCIRLPDSKSGARTVRLGAPALELLATLPRTAGSPFVFASAQPGRVTRADGGHFVNVDSAWFRVRKAAGLDGLRIHDLRHSYGAIGASGGMSLRTLGELLGHRHAATTQRYAHLSNDPLQIAAESISAVIAGALSGKESAEVVEMPRRAK